jgi:hypothetical protein
MRFLGRARDLAARFLASDASEKVTVLAGGPAARAGGACAGAVALCLVTGAVGPGVGGLDISSGGQDRARMRTGPVRHATPMPAVTGPALASESPPPRPAPDEGARQKATTSGSGAHPSKTERETRQVKRQTDGFARAASESTSAPPPAPPVSASSASEQTEVPAGPACAGSSDSEEAAQAKQQFGAFK